MSNDYTVIEKEVGSLETWTTAPTFWKALPKDGMPFVWSLASAQLRTIGRSSGGREIVAVEYGEREPVDALCDNLHSAIASKIDPPDPTDIFPSFFYGARRRARPVLALQGALHGSELTGTVAMLNLCQVIETGADLRGKSWPDLREVARATRLVMIPWLNIDGASRAPWGYFVGMPPKASALISHGVGKEGMVVSYPEAKRYFPVPPERVHFLGTYYNDAGYNLQYDTFTLVRQPETQAWMAYYLAERPDGVLIWHCNAGSMIGPPSYYLPPGHQLQEARIAGAVRARLVRDGYAVGRLSRAQLPGMGKPYLEQVAAVYHVCGAMPVMCELPEGSCAPFSAEDMLDIGLITIEETLRFAHTDGLRPYEWWTKVKRTLGASSSA